VSIDLLLPDEVAEVLRISKDKTYRLIREQEIKSIRIGRTIRIRRSDLEEYIVKVSCSEPRTDPVPQGKFAPD